MGLFGFNVIKESKLSKILEAVNEYRRTLEDIGWINLSTEGMAEKELIAGGYEKMLKRCKLYFYNNPLAGHWINLTTAFTFGQGISIPKAKDKKVQEIIDEFWFDEDNQRALTSNEAQISLSNKFQYEGNLYFVLFINETTGVVKVRILDAIEIKDIITDVEDRLKPVFYKKALYTRSYDFGSDSWISGGFKGYMYYRDWKIDIDKLSSFIIPEAKLIKDAVIYHVKINCDINDKFGVPDLYRGLDWIKAHKDMAGDLATLIRSLSSIAWKKKIKGTPAQVAALKTALHAKTDLSNIPPAAGSTHYENQALELEAINISTGGVVIGKEGLRQMLLPVCAASGIFEHYFGNPETGNLATATSMELPMVKKFLLKQQLWIGIYQNILQFQIDKKIATSQLDEDVDRFIDLDFPPIIEKELEKVANAMQTALMNSLISNETSAQIFMLAAGVNNVDEELKKMFPKKEKPGKEEEIEETIETPSKIEATRFVHKNNHVLERLSGYRKILAGHYRNFENKIKDSIKTAGEAGQIAGDIEDLDKHLDGLVFRMQNAAKIYFPIAIDIGKKFMQAYLSEKKIKESLFEAKGGTNSLLKKRLDWNEKFLTTSLIPDIKKALEENLKMPYASADEFNKATDEALKLFEGRIEQYAGAFWSVEEEAVKETGKDLKVEVNFIGADDGATCEDCQRFMEGNPYSLEDAPVPGLDPICNGRCRHALQVIKVGDKEL